MSQLIEVKVPDIGSDQAIPVIEILAKVGDRVELEQALLTLESDKATVDVPSPIVGEVKEINVKVGDRVGQGQVIFKIERAVEKAAAEQTNSVQSEAVKVESAPQQNQALLEVKVPDIGGIEDVPVIDVLIKVGDVIELEQSLITLESDKVTMDIPSSVAGEVKEIHVKVGDRVSEGHVVVKVLGSGASKTDMPSSQAAVAAPMSSETVLPAKSEVKPEVKPESSSMPAKGAAPGVVGAGHASPSIRHFAHELGVNVSHVQGSGLKGRITREDVMAYVKNQMTHASQANTSTGAGIGGLDVLPWTKVDFAKFGAFEAQPLSRIKKIAGANLHRNWVMIPHVTNNDEADVTDLEALRLQLNKEQQGVKFTMLSFVVKAVVAALKKFPIFNTSLDEEQLIYKQYYHIGFAADTPNGLVVPVIRDADQKSLTEIAQKMKALSGLAREGKLKPDQMQGGCFSISSLGGIGGTHFTPIINAPEVAILGLSRSYMKPVWDGEQFKARLTLPMSLSYDHRVIDGADAARFNAYLVQVLSDFRRVLL